jgi:hypothetical protein
LPGLGFVASSFGFYYPADPEAGLDGFDLDGRVSSSDSPAADECAHDDFMGPNQEPGIDYGFLHIIANEEMREDGKYVFGGFREGQLVDGVIGGAVKNGSMTILLSVQGLDDPENDEDVIELGDGTFQGTVSGYWDVANIRDIIGTPTTQNGNAANFTIEQFEAGMAELADGDYDAGSGLCNSFSTMFQFRGLKAFIVSESTPGGAGGSGSGGGGGVPQPYDQCVNDADQAALEALATEDQSGPAVVGMIAGACPIDTCGSEVAAVLSDTSEVARNALGDCIAQCISDRTGLSAACTGCYGTIAACSTAFCLAPCLQDAGSEECANCALENCIDVNACTGLY